MQKLGVSERKVCNVLKLKRTTKRYKFRKSDDEQALKSEIIRLVSKYGRYGYRRITAMLKVDTVLKIKSQAYLKRIFSLKFELFLRTAKIACNNFLITAQTICFQNFLRDLSFLANSAKDGQQRIAVVAGKYRAFLKIALPNFVMEVLECTEVPEFLCLGVTPTYAANCRALSNREIYCNGGGLRDTWHHD